MTAPGRSDVLPPEAWAVALSLLPGCGQQRLQAVLASAGHDPSATWHQVVDGRVGSELAATLGGSSATLLSRWRTAAQHFDPAAMWRTLTDDGVGVWMQHTDGYPSVLADDPDPAPILYWRGDPQALERPTVAIVGTRRCTAYGTDVARSLGRDLAAAGVAVVSGLALGIDGAAHEGALAAGHRDGRLVDDEDEIGDRSSLPAARVIGPPIGVVGSGLDVVYPPRHRALWQRVADHGLLITEAPLGSAPEAWRFPRRNRILAALATVVVVVESHASGGSLSTVRNAIDRGVTVMAVPGSVRSPSSAGTNRLLADGVAPVTDAADVLVALSLEGVGAAPLPSEPVDDSPVLAAVDWTPTSTEDVLRRTGQSLGEAAKELARLEVAGRVRRRGGRWERR